MGVFSYTAEEISAIKKYAADHICPHYMSNADLDEGPKVYVKSEGNYVYDIEGRRYLDSFASILTTICGHNNMDIIDAICEQIKVLDFFRTLATIIACPWWNCPKNWPKYRLRLTSYFYVNSGSEANETAIKAPAHTMWSVVSRSATSSFTVPVPITGPPWR